MDSPFFERPILNSPYEYPSRHWELDEHRQPTNRIEESRRRESFLTPIPRPITRLRRLLPAHDRRGLLKDLTLAPKWMHRPLREVAAL